jgi:hypothetical protein
MAQPSLNVWELYYNTHEDRSDDAIVSEEHAVGSDDYTNNIASSGHASSHHADSSDVDTEKDQSDSGIRFSFNLGKDTTRAKICRYMTGKETRADIRALHRFLTVDLRDYWFDGAVDMENFPLLYTKSIKMDTRSESSGLSLESGYTQKDVNVYRYLDSQLTIYLYRVGMGGSGSDSSIKTGGTGVQYGVSVDGFLPSKPEGDYTKMLIFGFPRDLKTKIEKKDTTTVKFPITVPPFSILLRKKNTSFGDKVKDAFTPSSPKDKKNKETGPFFFYCSKKYDIPSLDRVEPNFWVFGFNRSNLLYIMDVHYGKFDANSPPPPPSDPPPPLPSTTKNTTSDARFNKNVTTTQNETNFGAFQPWFKNDEDFVRVMYAYQNELKDNKILYTTDDTFRNALRAIFSLVTEDLKTMIMSGAMSKYLFAPLGGYAKVDLDPSAMFMDKATLQSRRLYLINSLFESDMNQRLIKNMQEHGTKGRYVFFANWLKPSFIRKISFLEDEMQNKLWFHRIASKLEENEMSERFLRKAALGRYLFNSDSHKILLRSMFSRNLRHIHQVLSVFSTLTTLIHLLHLLARAFHKETKNSKGLENDYPFVPVVKYNYEIIPDLYPLPPSSSAERNYTYKPEIMTPGDKLEGDPSSGRSSSTLPSDGFMNSFFQTGVAGLDRWLQAEEIHSEKYEQMLHDMNPSQSGDVKTLQGIEAASTFSMILLSYIDYLTTASLSELALYLGNSPNEEKSVSNLILYGFQTLLPLTAHISEDLLYPAVLPSDQREPIGEEDGKNGVDDNVKTPKTVLICARANMLRILLGCILKTSLTRYYTQTEVQNGTVSQVHAYIHMIMNAVSSNKMHLRESLIFVLNLATSFIVCDFDLSRPDFSDAVPPSQRFEQTPVNNFATDDVNPLEFNTLLHNDLIRASQAQNRGSQDFLPFDSDL